MLRTPFTLIFTLALSISLIYALQSLQYWGIAHDVSVLSYDGFLALSGKKLYLDFLEYNTPATILLYAFQISIFGLSDKGWLFSLFLWYLLGAWGIWSFLKRSPPIYRVFGSLLFIILEMTGGHSIAGQRDFFAGIFCLWAAVFLLKLFIKEFEPNEIKRSSLFAGLLFGTAVALRPHLILIPAWMLLTARKAVLQHRTNYPLFFFGLILPWLAALTFLFWQGGLSEYVSFVYNFQILVYTNLGAQSLLGMMSSAIGRFCPILTLFAIHGFILRSFKYEQQIAAAGLFGAIAAYILQLKGWPYQLSPAVPFFTILAVYAMMRLERRHARHSAMIIVPVLAFLLYFYSPLGLVNRRRLAPMQGKTTKLLVKELNDYDIDNKRIQPLDLTGGTLHALLILKKPPATRFIYDVYFYNEIRSSFARKVREEFIATIKSQHPDLIILNSFSWPDSQLTFSRLNRFLPLRKFLEDNYLLCSLKKEYWIYSLRSIPGKNCRNAAHTHESIFGDRLIPGSTSLLLTHNPKPSPIITRINELEDES